MSSIVSWVTEAFGSLGLLGLFVVAFAESSFFPVPPDVMLIPMSLTSPRSALLYAAVTTAASVIGGIFGYLIGVRGGRPILARITGMHNLEKVQTYFQRWGGWAVGIAAFTPIPYKVFTIASGIFRVRMAPFLIASAIGRGARFGLEALMVLAYGENVRQVLGTKFELITLALSLAAVAIAVIVGAVSGRRRDVTGSIARRAAAAVPPGSRRRRMVEMGIYILAGLVFLTIVVREFLELLAARGV